MAIKNMQQLKLKKQQLEFQSKFYEKELVSSAAGILDNFTDKLRGLTFDLGYRLISNFIFSRRKRRKESSFD
jgi:hypothetical protein